MDGQMGNRTPVSHFAKAGATIKPFHANPNDVVSNFAVVISANIKRADCIIVIRVPDKKGY